MSQDSVIDTRGMSVKQMEELFKEQVKLSSEGNEDADPSLPVSPVVEEAGTGSVASEPKRKPGRPKGSTVKRVTVTEEHTVEESGDLDDDLPEMRDIHFFYPVERYVFFKLLLSRNRKSVSSFLREACDTFLREHFAELESSFSDFGNSLRSK